MSEPINEGSGGSTDGEKVSADDEVQVSPADGIRLKAPWDRSQRTELRITNNRADGKAIIYKLKCTRPDRFRMQPVFGGPLAAQGAQSTVVLGNGGAFDRDRVTVLYAVAPTEPAAGGGVAPAEAWRDTSRKEIQEAQHRILTIAYDQQSEQNTSEKAQTPSSPPPTPPKTTDTGKRWISLS